MPNIVAEDDVIIRASQVILDPETDPERYAAIMDYYRVDLPDFDGWVGRMRRASGGLFPARFEMVSKIEAYHEAIADADGIICESLPVGEAELGAALEALGRCGYSELSPRHRLCLLLRRNSGRSTAAFWTWRTQLARVPRRRSSRSRV